MVPAVIGPAVGTARALADLLCVILVDLWKNRKVTCLDAFYPKMKPGAIIVADNRLHPGGEDVSRYAMSVRARPAMTSVRRPVGRGLEISRFTVS